MQMNAHFVYGLVLYESNMHALGHFCTLPWNLGAVCAWEELGSVVWKASNTLYILLMGIIHCDTRVIWVENQQLSKNNKRQRIVMQMKLQVIFKSIFLV